MDELAKKLDTLRDEVSPGWDDARAERLFAGVGQLRSRRRRQRVISGAAAMLGLLVLGGGYLLKASPLESEALAKRQEQAAPKVPAHVSEAQDRSPAKIAAGERTWLSDGSLVQVISGAGALEVLRDDASRIGLRLLSGAAHFEVVPGKPRAFVVDAGHVRVSVVGTVFDVERSADRVRVTVTEGKVRVSLPAHGASYTSIVAGETRWFDASGEPIGAPGVDELEGERDAEQAARSEGRRSRPAHRDGAAKGAHASSWRSLTQAGKYEEAYRSLAAGAVVDDDASALMDAADAARLSGHAEMATTFLRRVVREHRQDPVAPLAAFTLGRVLLERLGQPQEAAESFAAARALSPHGSLAQDALAREVEALSKAGNAHEAFLRARAYVAAYPNGRRLQAVQLYGGLVRE